MHDRQQPRLCDWPVDIKPDSVANSKSLAFTPPTPSVFSRARSRLSQAGHEFLVSQQTRQQLADPSASPSCFCEITYYLSTPELGNVRLTCKALERSLFNFFSHEFFRKKQFMMFEDSLSALIEISKHPALAPFLVRRDLSTSGSRFVGQI